MRHSRPAQSDDARQLSVNKTADLPAFPCYNPTMLRRLVFTFTFFCVAICLLSPLLVLCIDKFNPTIHHVDRNADGSSIGVYMNDMHDYHYDDYYWKGPHVLVRRLGFADGHNGESYYDPVPLVLFAIPPLAWLFASRRNAGRHRRVRLACAASPLALTLMMIYGRELSLLPFILLFTASAAIITIPRLRQRIIQNRIKKGLCPVCTYDLRATAEPTGLLLPRCPECGGPSPSSILHLPSSSSSFSASSAPLR